MNLNARNNYFIWNKKITTSTISKSYVEVNNWIITKNEQLKYKLLKSSSEQFSNNEIKHFHSRSTMSTIREFSYTFSTFKFLFNRSNKTYKNILVCKFI